MKKEEPKNEIYSNEEYLALFSKVAKANLTAKDDENTILKEAFRIALDTRKFEIELYWKRASYFWVIIASSLTGYIAIIKTVKEIDFMVLLVAFLGYNFSLAWYFVNRGSKYWQENWEYHVGQLEDKVIGPLYKIIKYPEADFINLTKEYPFSVSRVNQLLSLLMIFVWVFLLCYSMNELWFKKMEEWFKYSNNIMCFVAALALALINGFIFFHYSKSFLGRDKSKFGKLYKKKKGEEVKENELEVKPIPKAIVKY